MPTVEYSTYAPKSTILALAQQDPDFAEFYSQYQGQIVLPAPLPIDFWDNVIAIAEKKPSLSSEVKCCRENVQAAQSFAIPGLPSGPLQYPSVLLYLGGNHIPLLALTAAISFFFVLFLP